MMNLSSVRSSFLSERLNFTKSGAFSLIMTSRFLILRYEIFFSLMKNLSVSVGIPFFSDLVPHVITYRNSGCWYVFSHSAMP